MKTHMIITNETEYITFHFIEEGIKKDIIIKGEILEGNFIVRILVPEDFPSWTLGETIILSKSDENKNLGT